MALSGGSILKQTYNWQDVQLQIQRIYQHKYIFMIAKVLTQEWQRVEYVELGRMSSKSALAPRKHQYQGLRSWW